MNSFSRPSTAGCSTWVRALTLLLAIACTGLPAHSSEDLFRGSWQVDTPEAGTLILLIKRNGQASYFWGDNTDGTVYKGIWELAENSITITWHDDSRHRLERDSPGYGITYFDADGHARYTTPAQQIPREILGQWAKPPTDSTKLAADRDKARGFFGIWQIGDAGESKHYIFVESDRSAASTRNTAADDMRGLRGSWAKQGNELHISWDSGHYSILREVDRGFAYKRINPASLIEDDETPFKPASRTSRDNLNSAWLTAYESERASRSGGVAFASRKSASQFYRGSWIVKHREDAFEKIELGRFGGLSTTRDSSLKGDWLLSGQDIFMRWDDGIRKILSPIGQGFVIYEYKPPRPLDGVPTRILPAAPADITKLAEHLQGRQEVARQMLRLAEAAGIKSGDESSSWGRTFMRWVWPFGGEDAASPDALLQQEGEVDADNAPWWWPFWSEKHLEESASSATDAVGEDAAIEPGGHASPPDKAAGTHETALTAESTTQASAEADEAIAGASAADTAVAPEREAPEKSASEWSWPF